MILALPVRPGMPSANIYAQFWCVFGDAKCQQQQQQLVYCSVCVWEGGVALSCELADCAPCLQCGIDGHSIPGVLLQGLCSLRLFWHSCIASAQPDPLLEVLFAMCSGFAVCSRRIVDPLKPSAEYCTTLAFCHRHSTGSVAWFAGGRLTQCCMASSSWCLIA